MKITVLIPADATEDVEYTFDGETILRAGAGDAFTVETDDEGEFRFRMRAVEKEVKAPSFEQPRPDAIASNPEQNSATSPGAQAAVEELGLDTPAGEPLTEGEGEGEGDFDEAEFDEVETDGPAPAGGQSELGGESQTDLGNETQTAGAEGQDSVQLVDASDDDVRAVIAALETNPSVERTSGGKVQVATVNEALEAKGFKPINAARRDAIAPAA